MTIKTYHDLSDKEYSDDEFQYQKGLTRKLDNSHKRPIDQETINEIVLWKVNRYSLVSEDALSSLNEIETTGEVLQTDLTRLVLRKLLRTHGIRLALASTILRFRNPRVFQIIDQRAFRLVYGIELKLSPPTTDVIVETQIELYLSYLAELKEISRTTGWEFSKLDRILYVKDKELNGSINIKYSG